MKYGVCFVLAVSTAMALGCSADVETTKDSHRIEVEVPKIEAGDEPLDADIGTDEDVDVDTSAPGDT